MPTQLYIGTMPINTFTLCLALGAMSGVAFTMWPAWHSWKLFTSTLTGLIIMAGSALAFGRLGYVLYNAEYFMGHITEIVSMVSPGIDEHAALVGGLLGLAVASRLRQKFEPRALIALATFAGIGASIGCIPNGCAYGREVYWTDGVWWQLRVDWPDAYTLNNPRLPAQLFMVVWLLILLLVILMIMRRTSTYRSQRALTMYPLPLWLVLFALGDFVIQFIRMDPMPLLGGLRVVQWADVILAGLGVAWIVLANSRHTKQHIM